MPPRAQCRAVKIAYHPVYYHVVVDLVYQGVDHLVDTVAVVVAFAAAVAAADGTLTSEGHHSEIVLLAGISV